MGRRGPVPQSDKLKLHGSRRARSDAKVEPEVEHTKPERPDWLTGEVAVNTWDRLCEQLDVSASDANVMSRYCITWSRWVQLIEHIDEVGSVYETTTKMGETKYYLRPEAKIVDQLAAQLLLLERELGMTPLSRSRLPKTKPKEKSNPKLRFFNHDDPA